jgi:hypothetical protein
MNNNEQQWNVYYKYNRPGIDKLLTSYGVVMASSEQEARHKLYEHWFQNTIEGHTFKGIDHAMPSHDFVDEDDYSTGF